MSMPLQITARDTSDRYPLHLFANAGKFPVKLTSWERGVLESELRSASLVAWYRNPTAGGAALAVPYSQGGAIQTMYPDFVFFHRDSVSGLVVDIVDPHRPNEADSGPKWHGLSKYAIEHKDSVRRVAAVIEDKNGKLLGLDLKNESVRDALGKASNEPDIRRIFHEFGGKY